MKKYTIALSGNPNAGKTTVFNAITGARQHIANYPGVTVEKKVGRVHHKGHDIEVVDLPGTYSLTAYSLEELVARDFVVNERPDIIIDIVDASNLDRNLYLAVQFMELGAPMIIALNMVDMAEQRGISIDAQELSTLLGMPVVPMVARTGKGIEDLLDAVLEMAGKARWEPKEISYGLDIDQSLNKIVPIIETSGVSRQNYPARWLALKCLEGDRQILDRFEKDSESSRQIEAICQTTFKHTMDTLEEDPEGVIADHRYGYIAGLTKKVLKRRIESRLNLSDKIDRVLTNRILGPLFMLAVLYLTYVFTFWASEVPVNWVEGFFEWSKEMVAIQVPAGNLRSLISSGVIAGVGGVLSFVPLIMFMFFAIAIMEDSGYMARIAYMLDRVLRWFGLHGNSVMALIVSGGISGGCAVPGVMATRTLRDPKERIATLLVVPFMNCGAKLPVFAMLIAAFFSKNQARLLFLLTLLSWAFALFAAKILRSTVLRGPKTPFVMELPPYRLPSLRGLSIHTWERTWQYIKKAGTVILAISILLWAMMTFPGLSENQVDSFAERREALTSALLESPGIREQIRDREELNALDELRAAYSKAVQLDDQERIEGMRESPLFSLVEASFRTGVGNSGGHLGSRQDPGARYTVYTEEMAAARAEEQRAALENTLAGRIGRSMEVFTKPLGFDYRLNISLVGGFAAKEVIISTLGTAYSLTEVDPESSGPVSEMLKRDSQWNPLLAFTFIVFTMLYVPCFVTLVSIRKESSWKWASFSVGFNLLIAYTVALIIRQAGLALGLGV
jgi:ferrous iron transport protein B